MTVADQSERFDFGGTASPPAPKMALLNYGHWPRSACSLPLPCLSHFRFTVAGKPRSIPCSAPLIRKCLKEMEITLWPLYLTRPYRPSTGGSVIYITERPTSNTARQSTQPSWEEHKWDSSWPVADNPLPGGGMAELNAHQR